MVAMVAWPTTPQAWTTGDERRREMRGRVEECIIGDCGGYRDGDDSDLFFTHVGTDEAEEQGKVYHCGRITFKYPSIPPAHTSSGTRMPY